MSVCHLFTLGTFFDYYISIKINLKLIRFPFGNEKLKTIIL